MYRKIDDFVKDYRQHSAEHAQLLDALTDASLGQRVAEGHRSLGYMGWHIVQSACGMAADAGLEVGTECHKQPVPGTAADYGQAYRAEVEKVIAAVQAQWTDELLPEEIPMYGEQWTRGFALAAIIGHETHHFGQMTVLMRQAGLPVHGVFGPSKEQWALYGVEQPADLA